MSLQATRRVGIASPLGDDALLLQQMTANEPLGRLFRYDLELLSEDEAIALDDILGQSVTVRVQIDDENVRYFNGFVSNFSQVGSADRRTVYRATLRPWLWFLTRTADCRIFQEKTVPDIVEEVFRDHGFTDFESNLSGSYRTWTYCVQYRETDFNFVSRLLEQEGIYYYFKHEDGKHTLVLADSYSAHEPYPNADTIKYYPPGDNALRDEDHIFHWELNGEVQPGTYALNDYDFTRPAASLVVNSSVTRNHDAAEFEIYDYPGEYTESGDGDHYVRTRIEELQARHETTQGRGNHRGIATGFLFTLSQYPRDDQNREYLVVSTTHEIRVNLFESGPGDDAPEYTVSFTAMDAQTPFRPQRITPKPLVQGPQTAMVVGKSGEEIWTDEHGRVKCKFHWDRYANADENDSCWIRVAQTWAGKGWGGIHVPRIGQEVIVEFLEGDPDRPIITGRVYNGTNKVPYELPTNQTMSGIKSNSSKGGGGFNEIRFEDKKDEEQIFIHGQKNQDIRIQNDCFEWIGHDRHLDVENDQVEHIKNNRSETVDNDHKEKIGKDRHIEVVGKEAMKIGGSQSSQVTGDVIEVYKANQSTEVSQDLYVKGTNIVIEGTSNVTIKVGDSYIAIESGGIKLGTNGDIVLEASGSGSFSGSSELNLESGGNVGVSAGGNCTVSGSMIELN